MTALVHDTDNLREINDGKRQAWRAYSDRLRDLIGEEYAEAESESWDELQRELRRLERRARTLVRNAG